MTFISVRLNFKNFDFDILCRFGVKKSLLGGIPLPPSEIGGSAEQNLLFDNFSLLCPLSILLDQNFRDEQKFSEGDRLKSHTCSILTSLYYVCKKCFWAFFPSKTGSRLFN